MITINPQAADVVTIELSDADQITLNTTAIVIVNDGASVVWGEITGTLSDQTDLQNALNLKLDAADYNDRFLGLFASVFDLEAAHPAASAGDYAQVDFGIGTDVIVYAWDVSDGYWAAVGSSAIANTDALPEGSSNLYHTGQRVRETTLNGLSTATNEPVVSTDQLLVAISKLQAQLDNLTVSQSPAYIAGRYYSQSSSASASVTTTLAANRDYFVPLVPRSDLIISTLSFAPSTPTDGRTAKIRIYSVINNVLTALTPVFESPANVAQAYTISAVNLALKRGQFVFVGFNFSANLGIRAIPSDSAPSVGGLSQPTHSSAWNATMFLTENAHATALPDAPSFPTNELFSNVLELRILAG